MLLDSSGRQVVWVKIVTVRLKFSCSAFLKPAPPARRIGRQAAQREADGIEVEAGIDSSAAIESALRIRVIEILDHAGHGHALEVIEGVLESPESVAAEVHHEELADQSAGIRQPLRVEVRL